ncbi:MAG TPA: glycosyltransferase [Pirellulales bacterium]|nr:glycosyltransferase [Pirellulales bacterium]
MTVPIYLEVFPLLVPKMTGIGRFSARLIQALNRLAPLRLTTFIEPRTARVHRLATDLARGQEIALEQGELSEAGDDLARWAREVCRRPKRAYDATAARGRTGIYTWARPDDRRFGREIGIFYDFTPLIVSQTHTAGLCESFHRQVFASRHCQKMLAISHSTRADAAWLSPVPADDVVVAYPGPSQCLARHAHAGSVERRRNAILIVGTREPRKNGDFLVDWFLHSRLLPGDVELWWAGPEGWLWDGPKPDRKNPRLKRIKFLGMVSDARLCELYQQATFTVYPSLYEGFGFPVLDSLLHGAPVLCSYNSSLVELESPGVFYFDPCDAATLDDAYRQLAATGPLTIDGDGPRRRFCWDTLARTVLSLAA